MIQWPTLRVRTDDLRDWASVIDQHKQSAYDGNESQTRWQSPSGFLNLIASSQIVCSDNYMILLIRASYI